MPRYLLLFQLIVFLIILPAGLRAQELEMINRPVNTSGLTGLIITTSPFTLPPKTVEIGVMTLSENSVVPEYSATAYPVTISLGITRNMEMALKGSYATITGASGSRSRGAGEMELAYKWNFRPQREFSNVPGIAVIASGMMPTGDRESGTNSVLHWGGRLGISLGSEIAWADYILGVFADAQVAVQDLSDQYSRDSYGIMNLGLIFPISKYRNLQMILEYNQLTGKEKTTVNIDGVNHNAVTYGLRLVSERFNLTFGAQFIHNTVEGYTDSSKIIGMMSMKF
jgi:hypothetical protein